MQYLYLTSDNEYPLGLRHSHVTNIASHEDHHRFSLELLYNSKLGIP